jgi:hypothetical protein
MVEDGLKGRSSTADAAEKPKILTGDGESFERQR